MTKAFKWSGWVKATNQGDRRCSHCIEYNNTYCSVCRDEVEAGESFIVYEGNFALDENGKPITRTDEEMENCDEE